MPVTSVLKESVVGIKACMQHKLKNSPALCTSLRYCILYLASSLLQSTEQNFVPACVVCSAGHVCMCMCVYANVCTETTAIFLTEVDNKEQSVWFLLTD